MTVRDLSEEDYQGFLHAHQQRANEVRFAQSDSEWTACSVLEDVLILAVVFVCCMALPVGFVLWKVFG